ncbi:hypothetical protein CRD97_29285 [Escherichia coli]|nr:hypothetical protein CRD97_29285 [Escherichia coli]
MSIYIDGRDCCQTGQFSQDVADGALTQQWCEGKLLLPSSESPQLLPVTLDAAAEQPESLAEDPETLSISCCQRRMTIAPFVTVCCKRMRTPGSTSCIAMVG